MTTTSLIGNRLPLKDGRERVTGTIRYATDISLPGMLHIRPVSSPYAHAAIRSIDPSGALEVPGVVSVLTAQDLPDVTPDSRHRLLLARDRVRFVGQPVALVLAESEMAAEDGVDAVYVDYDPLPVFSSMDEALTHDAPLVWPEGVPGGSDEAAAHGAAVEGEEEDDDTPGNVTNRIHFTRGDVQQGLAEAACTVDRTFTTSWVHQSYLEPHATVAQPDPSGNGMTLWTSTQAPFYIQTEVAAVLGISEDDVRLVPMPVGGGFGGKFILYEPLVALVAQKVGRPVRFVLTRMEEMASGNPAPQTRMRVRLGARADGTLTALDAEMLFDAGCYPGSPVGIAAMMMGSTYQVPNLEIKGMEVLTFKPSQGAYRAPGAPQATYALESAMDDLARELGMDPLDLRLKNASRSGDPMVRGDSWPTIGLREVLEKLGEHPAWREREDARARGHGIGIAVGGWPGGTEPAAASCFLQRDGSIRIEVGSVDLTGTDTTLALLAAETFGVAPDKVRIAKGDTLSMPYAGAAGGSKITYTVGPAVIAAAHDARQQLLAIAADELEANPEDLEIVDGAVQVRGAPDSKVTLRDIAGQTMRFGGRYAPVQGNGRHAETRSAPGFCAQLAEVSVDPESGEVQVHRIVSVQDVGRAINPLLIEGQMMGGAVQGLGWALYEGIYYDADGQLLTGSMMDYGFPKIGHSAPKIDTVLVEVPSDHGPMGARGVGEPPVIATAAAVANAITDATGKRVTDLPMTAPRVLAALREG